MANFKCASCGLPMEAGSTFCEGCGAAVASRAPSAAAPTIGTLSRIERAVYFRVARAFSWVVLIIAIAILIFSALKAAYSVGDLLGGKKGVTKDEVQASLDTGRSGSARKNRDADSVSEDSDPKLIGEYEAALAQMVLIFPQQDRDQAGGDERLRGLLKQTIQGVVQGKRGQITLVGEARELVGQFGEKDRKEAFQNFLALRGEKEQLAMQRQTEARANMLYLGGTALATAMLITMLSMVLLLLTIERNTRPK